jgi:hypothetical protein
LFGSLLALLFKVIFINLKIYLIELPALFGIFARLHSSIRCRSPSN